MGYRHSTPGSDQNLKLNSARCCVFVNKPDTPGNFRQGELIPWSALRKLGSTVPEFFRKKW
jgi:hypothetical protein